MLALAAVVVCVGLAAATSACAQVDRVGTYKGASGSMQLTPMEITGLPEPPTQIDASNYSSYALEPNGSVYAWGAAAHGDLGARTSKTYDAAVKVNFPAGVKLVAIGEARDSGFAIDSTGQGWAWGSGSEDGASGNFFCNGDTNISSPAKVPGISHAIAVQGGQTHVMWLLANGAVLGCGQNQYGELGLGEAVRFASTLTQLPVSNVVEISAGERQALVRTAEGKVFAFGFNGNGESCAGAAKIVWRPTEIPLPGRASEISAGGDDASDGQSLIMVEGVPYGCGNDKWGQLGDGQLTDKYTPTVASELLTLGLTEVATAGRTSIGVSSSGEVYTWGSAEEGDLGDGNEEGFSRTPFPVAGGAVEVSGTARNLLFRG